MKRFIVLCALLVSFFCFVELLNKADVWAADFDDNDLFYVYDPDVRRYYYPTVETFLTWLRTQGDILQEADPLFTASPSSAITQTNITNWNTSFTWGPHAGLYEPVLGNPVADGYCLRALASGTRFWGACGDGESGGVGTEVDPIFSVSPAATITNTQKTNWDTAFSWGAHTGLYSLSSHDHAGEYQPWNTHLDELSSGTLAGSKVGTGISGTNITLGTVADARIDSTIARTSQLPTLLSQLTNDPGYITSYTVTEGDVTSHEGALTITESQISDLGTYLTSSDVGVIVQGYDVLLTDLATLTPTPGTSYMLFYNGASWALSTELSISEIDLPSAAGYKIDGNDSGFVVGTLTLTTTAANAFDAGTVGFISSAGTVTLTDASAEATAKNMLVVATATIAGGASGVFTRTGEVTVTAHGFELGAPLFLSETAGAITTTAPSTAGSIVRVVGYALDANTLYVAPDATYIEL